MKNAYSIGEESSSSVAEARFLLDTNICVYLAENVSELLAQRIERCSPGEVVTSSIAFAEFARGIDWSQPKAHDTVERLFMAIPILSFDRAAAMAYIGLPFARHRLDRLIAAHALALDLTLVTANVRDFRGIADLKVEDWTT